MPELAEVNPVKTAGFVDRGSNYQRKQKRMEEDEKEIAALEAKARGEEEPGGDAESEGASSESSESETVTTTPTEEANLSREEQSFKKRYGDLRRHMSDKEKEWKDKFDSLEARLRGETVVMPKSDEDIAAWSNQYPDVAAIVETIATKKAKEMFSKADSRLQELDKIQNEAARKTAEQKIKESHPDFDQLKSSDTFHDWAEVQPKWVQDAIYENADDPASVIRVLDLYKIDNNLTTSANKAKTKAAASSVNKTTKTSVDLETANGTIRESDVAKMSTEEFAKREEEITKAIRTGKFVYDISGSAR